MNTGRIAAAWLAGSLAAAGAGCFGGGENTVASSGDYEADQRADQHMGAETDGRGGKEEEGKAPVTLYQRLGGEEGLRAIVDEWAQRAIADPRVNFNRKDVKRNWLGDKYDEWKGTPDQVERFKSHTVEFLALASGGPAKYTGRDLREVHDGMKISNSEFDAMVGDLKLSMDRLGTPAREKRDLLAAIETTREQIVEER